MTFTDVKAIEERAGDYSGTAREDVNALCAEVRRLRDAEREGYRRGLEKAQAVCISRAELNERNHLHSNGAIARTCAREIGDAVAALSPGSERGGG